MSYMDIRWCQRVSWSPHADTPWLAYPLVLDSKAPFTRKQLQIHFEKNGIQVRTIFTGNITRQPIMKDKAWKGHNNFSIADEVMKNGMLIGIHQGMTEKEVNTIKTIFTEFINKC